MKVGKMWVECGQKRARAIEPLLEQQTDWLLRPNSNIRKVASDMLATFLISSIRYVKKAAILSKQSLTISWGACPLTRRFRADQSKFFIWSVKMTP